MPASVLSSAAFGRDVLAGADFLTVEVLTLRGLVTYYILFFIHLESRRVSVAGVTRHPDQEWMEQIARSATQETRGHLHPCRYVMHDRDTKFLRIFSIAAGRRRRENHSASGEKPESERFCRTLGSLGQAGVSVKVDFLMLATSPKSAATRSSIAAASGACSSIMDAPHE